MKRFLCALAALSITVGTSATASADNFSKAEVLDTAKELAKQVRMPSDTRHQVLKKLKKVLRQKRFRRIQGVFAYQIGEGGFLVKFLKGSGQARIKGADKTWRIGLEATSFGAQVGGSSEWGIGLITNLDDPKHFGGIYKGSKKGAVAIETGLTIARMFQDDPDEEHDLYFIGASKGLSAGVATAKLTISVWR